MNPFRWQTSRSEDGLVVALLFGCFALRFLVFFHGFALFLGHLLGYFLLLLGGLAGLTAIFSDTSVFTLSIRWDRPCDTQGEQQQESADSFHDSSEKKIILQRFYTDRS
jgi:hypothetical protein